MKIRVLITSGVRMFHLPFLAAALQKHESEIDYRLLMGLYPLPIIIKLFNFLPFNLSSKIVDRFQDIPSSRIIINPITEFLIQLESYARRFKVSDGFRIRITNLISFLFARKASFVLSKFKPSIYHYRCAYALRSLDVADEIHAIKLCDHSIAHPDHIAHLIEFQGRFPETQSKINKNSSVRLYFEMKADLQRADHIVVNSEFVKDSLVLAGISSSSISVIELSVDQKITHYSLKNYHAISKKLPSELLYAGGWVERKGVIILNQAIDLLKGKATLKVAGASMLTAKSLLEHRHIKISPYITALGYLSRENLALEMIKSSIFVFPSFCEGYAKVIQEAMICGSYIITTKNSGFSLFPGAHGTIVEPGAPEQLAAAIGDAISNPDLHELCDQNREVSLERFSSKTYSSLMAGLYKKLYHQRQVTNT